MPSKETPEQKDHRLSHSDWVRAHDLLDQHGVLTAKPGEVGTHLLTRLEAVLKVWDAVGQHSAQVCHDLQFLCNSNPEIKAAIEAHRAAFRPPTN